MISAPQGSPLPPHPGASRTPAGARTPTPSPEGAVRSRAGAPPPRRAPGGSEVGARRLRSVGGERGLRRGGPGREGRAGTRAGEAAAATGASRLSPASEQASAARAPRRARPPCPPRAGECWSPRPRPPPRRRECGRGARGVRRRLALPEVRRFVRPTWAAPRSGPRRCFVPRGAGRAGEARGRRSWATGRAGRSGVGGGDVAWGPVRGAFVAQECSLGLFKVQVIRSVK